MLVTDCIHNDHTVMTTMQPRGIATSRYVVIMIRLITMMKYSLICRHLRAPTGTPHAVVGGADVTQTTESGVAALCQMHVLTSVSSRSLFTH